jgi:hypothetical protein
VRVTKTDDSTVVLHSPKLVGDTLVGFVDRTRRALPLSKTMKIDTWHAAPDRTAAAVVFGGGLAALTYLIVSATNQSSSPRGLCCPPGVPCVEGWPPCM